MMVGEVDRRKTAEAVKRFCLKLRGCCGERSGLLVFINRTSDVRLELGGQEDAVLLVLSTWVAS
jgi:hypothetical protein